MNENNKLNSLKVFAVAAIALLTPYNFFAHAQDAPPAANVESPFERLQQSSRELEEIRNLRGVTEKRAAELAAEVEKIRKDRASITAALIQSAKTEKKLAGDIYKLEEELKRLVAQEEDIRTSLWQRRGVLAEVLAALQRMGLNPPPALLVKPEDALGSVRSAIILSAVVPHMRRETAILLTDIKELAQTTASIKAEREKLDTKRIAQADEQARLTLLVQEKRDLEGKTAEELKAEQQRMGELIARADSLEELVSTLQAAADAQRKADEQERLLQESIKNSANANQSVIDAARKRAEDLANRQKRLTPTLAFSKRIGQLAKPVAGRTITAFGDDDGLGTTARGDTIETSPNAIVTAPVDGVILYAGPFRAYGNLLILDAGEEYNLVLAGMDRIDVAQGQFVLEGEPVGAMGRIRLASVTAAATNNENPTLYIEFRAKSKPIDPAPWWERVTAGRT